MAAVISPAVLIASPAVADSTRDRQWYLEALDIEKAHRITQGEGVTVGVIDTGVRASHPDLKGSVLPGIDLTGSATRGWADDDGHGTGMAGIIAAHGSQGRGALGIAPRAKIFPARTKVGDLGNANNLPVAIRSAVDNGATVLSMSLTSGTFEALKSAVDYAEMADVVIVAGAGNRPDDIDVGYPARYPGVVAVSATGKDGKIAPISISGKEIVLAAPGVEIYSTDGRGGYRTGTGTSDATAIVAGAAALVRSKYPKLSAAEVVHRLTATATDKGAPGRDPEYGYGSLNLVAALTADVPPLDSTTPLPSAASPTTPPTAVTTAPDRDVAAPLRLNPAIFAIGALFAALFLGGIVALAWWLLRRRR